MNKASLVIDKIKTALRIIVIFTLILGILSTCFGVGVVAMKSINDNKPQQSTENPEENPDGQPPQEEYKDPVAEYGELSNTVGMNDDIKVLTKDDTNTIARGLISSDVASNGTNTVLQLTGMEYTCLDTVSNGEIIFFQGAESDPLFGDRAFKLVNKYTSNDCTYVELKEPEFEEVFETIEYSATDILTEENLEMTYCAEGVSAHFGDIETELVGVSKSGEITYDEATDSTVVTSPSVQTLSADADSTPELSQTTTDNVSKHGDLIIEVDFDFSKIFNKDDKNENSATSKSFGLKGSFGIKDISTHIIFDVPEITDWREVYVGLSGEVFGNLEPYGKIEIDGSNEASKKEWAFLSLEALNEKRLPIAVFKFQGTTPVYISNKTFNESKKAVTPSLYIVLFADWEGKISIELSGTFELSHAFNSGLSIVQNSKFNLGFQSYPYHSDKDITSEDGFKWHIGLAIDADTDLTLFGASLLFYIAGVNIAELAAIKIGFEAACKIDLIEFGSDVTTPLWDEDASFYLRGYVKILQVNVKIKAQGKGWVDFLSADIKFNFTLLDMTFLERGIKPDKFTTKIPISTMLPPDEFNSVIVLVTDVSGSMSDRVSTGETKLEATKIAAQSVIDFTKDWAETYQQVSGIGLVQFASNGSSVAVPHIDYEYLKSCVSSMGDGGGTNIESGIDVAISQLDAVKAANKTIILMSDGQQNNGNAMTAANKAAGKGIKIYTIGFGNGADSSLLTSVATTTGGEYKFADTNSIMSIFGGFLYAQQASEAEVLADISSSVSQGETTDATTFEINDKSGNLLVTTAWPGSFLDTILIDPNGRVVDENYPGSVTDESKIPSTISVSNPIHGKWKVKIKGVETSYDKEPFYTIVSFKEVDAPAVNSSMTDLEKAAAYCIAIGLFSTIASILLLPCLKKTKIETTSKA